MEPPLPKNSEESQKKEEVSFIDIMRGEGSDVVREMHELLSIKAAELPQDEVTARLSILIPILETEGVSGNEFCFSLPSRVGAEDLNSGNSPYAKVYRALFELSRDDYLEQNTKASKIIFEMLGSIDQNPQMIGPVGMWETAKAVLWRRDIASWAKQSLFGSMTYALAFFDQDKYADELLKQLDLETVEDYSETVHLLEAIKGFWTAGQESYAHDRGVSNFFVKVLEKLETTPDSNFLLSLRASELGSMLKDSEEFPNEGREKIPFEISKGQYASSNTENGLLLVPTSETEKVRESINKYQDVQGRLMPPQWMVDEAFERGDRWVSWMPPQELSNESQQLFSEMHSYATIPITDALQDGGGSDQVPEQLVYDYEYLLSKPIRTIIQREFSFYLKDLAIKEQLYFLNYLKQITLGEANIIKNFTSIFGVEGMRTFLALERGAEDLGDKIVAFGQHEELANKVFSYYSELLDIAERAEELVKEKTDCEGEVCLQLTNQVRENILTRGQKDLEAAVRATDPGEIEGRIETYVAEAKECVAVLQELGVHETEKLKSSELTESDKVRMIALLEQNYSVAYPGVENEVFRETIKSSLEKSFTNPQTEFHILRDGSVPTSFNRFDISQNAEGRTVSYFGSFNADPAYSGVGGVMLERTIKEQLENCDVMYAHCDPTSDIAKKYIESGFVAKETETVAGKLSFEIWRTKDTAEHLRSKQMSVEDLVRRVGQGEEDHILVREAAPNDTFEELDEGLGYLLTRYFKQGDTTYAVFEIPSPTLWNQFQA